MRTKYEGTCCVDCVLILANDDCGENTDTHRATMRAHLGVPDFGHAVVTSDGEGDFSWRQCDGCGSTLGGDRYAFVVLEPDDEPRQPCGHPMSQYDPRHGECTACCAIARMGDD